MAADKVWTFTTGASTTPGGTLTNSGPITISGQNGTVIQNLKITSTSGPCIQINNSSNVVIRNSEIGPCGGNGIRINGGSGHRVLDNYIHPETLATVCCDNFDGVFATSTSDILIQGNVIAYSETNIEFSGVTNGTAKGNFLLNPRGPFPRGQQFQAWGGNSNIVVENNYALSSLDSSKYKYDEHQEDAINFGDTKGIIVRGNYVRGGHSVSGCAVIVDWGSTNGQFLNNIVIDTAQCGLSIANGMNNVIDGSKIINSTPVQGGGNTAIMIWNQYSSLPCSTVRVSNNIASQIKPDGSESGYWNGGGCDPVTVTGNTFDSAARQQLTPVDTKLPAPKIPPEPNGCVIASPFTNQTSKAACR
jgi:hypothetical protein